MPLFVGNAFIGDVLPSDHNYLGWAFDPGLVIGSLILPTAGQLNLTKVKVPGGTITNIIQHVTTAGATLTAGQCFAGLFSAAGVFLAATADLSTVWQSSGVKTQALTAPQTVPPGYVYVGWYGNGVTLPTMTRGANTSAAGSNAGLSAPNLRYATADAGLTTALPGTIGAQTSTSTAYWVGVS